MLRVLPSESPQLTVEMSCIGATSSDAYQEGIALFPQIFHTLEKTWHLTFDHYM